MGLVEVTFDEGIAVCTLNRPEKLNALSTAVEREFSAALSSAEVRAAPCLVVAGGGRAFSAGADVGELRGSSPADVLANYRGTGEVYEQLAAFPRPTIAAIHGYCLGGGFELALACDFRVADATAVFGLPEVSIGILPSAGGTLRLVRAVGPARAKELMLLRRRFGPQEASAWGLVTEVAPEGRALARALELARELAALPPLAVEVARRAAEAVAGAPRDAALLIERLGYGLLAQTRDAREAADAFLERREPRFEGR